MCLGVRACLLELHEPHLVGQGSIATMDTGRWMAAQCTARLCNAVPGVITVVMTMAGIAVVGKDKKKSNKKQKVAPWDDIPDDSESEEESDAAEWVMHQPSTSRPNQDQTAPQTDKRDRSKKGKVHKGKKPRSSKSLPAFASADDYMPEIDSDLAALPADVLVGQEEGASGSKPHRVSRKTKSRQ